MSLFRPAAVRSEKRSLDSLAELLTLSRGPRTYSGEWVGDEQALRLGAVWQCVDLIAELIATLPIDQYRRIGDARPQPMTASPLLTDPVGDDSGFEVWCRQIVEALLLRGNSFGFITELDAGMWPRHIEVLHPDRVTVRRELSFGPVTWWLDNKEIVKWPAGPLWHIAAYNTPGSPLGRSAIRYAAETIGLGLATQRFGAQWFGDGAHPTATLESDDEIDEEQAKLLKVRIANALHGTREPLVLGGGTKLTPIQVNPEESQFLETAKANADDVARFFFRRPPGEGGEITYANVEARSIDMLTYTVNGWLVRLEQAISRLHPRGQFVKFNAGALLRTDLKTRYESHVLAVRGGIATVNERRELEDLPPLPDGDQLLWPPFATKSDSPEAAEVL